MLPADFRTLSQAEESVFLLEHLHELSLRRYRPRAGQPTALVRQLLDLFGRLADACIAPERYVAWAQRNWDAVVAQSAPGEVAAFARLHADGVSLDCDNDTDKGIKDTASVVASESNMRAVNGSAAPPHSPPLPASPFESLPIPPVASFSSLASDSAPESANPAADTATAAAATEQIPDVAAADSSANSTSSNAGDGNLDLESLEEAASQLELARAFQKYQRIKDRESVMNFDDQIANATRLLRECPRRVASVAPMSHVMVDEFQVCT